MAFSLGNQEIGLPKVDRLIKERNYNEAILALVEYMEENPKDFEGAQKRIKKIIELREDYNAHAQSLLEVMVNEPTNDKKKLDMIASMENLEKNPNLASQRFIDDTKNAAQFTYFRALFEEVMQKSNNYIDSSSYILALETLNTGFIIYKDDFDLSNNPILVHEVNQYLESIQDIVFTISETFDLFSDSAHNVAFNVSTQNYGELYSSYEEFAHTFVSLVEVRNKIATFGWFFEDSFETLSLNDEYITDNSFLPFAYRLVLGRKNTERYEGFIGTFDSLINAHLDVLSSSFLTTIESLWNSIAFKNNIDVLESILVLTDYGSKVASLYEQVDTREFLWGQRNYLKEQSQFNLVKIAVQSQLDFIPQQQRVLQLHAELTQLPLPLTNTSSFRAETSTVVHEREQLIYNYEQVSVEIEQTENSIRIQGSSEPGSIPESIAFDVLEYKREIETEIKEKQNQLYQEIFSWYEASIRQDLLEDQEQYRYAVRLLEGIPSDNSLIVRYYPAESIASLTDLKKMIQTDILLAKKAVNHFAEVEKKIEAHSVIVQNINQIKESETELNRLDIDIGTVIAKANSRVLQANLAKQESELRYNQALASLKRNDFQIARDNLQRARDRAIQSLEFQESEEYRTETDEKLANLGNEITRIENEFVVKEVRTLITSGKNFYYQGNFDQAEQVLNQAKARWSVTNIEENAEVVSWLGIVNTALSMQTGRTLPITAPLYPQMSQLLNTASQLYNQGKDLINQGKRAQAIPVLTEAKEKLQQLKLVYPLNEEAGQLTLKIDQVIDPVAFNESFRQKITIIKANYKSEPQARYSELLDLYKLNPSYSGISALKDEVEIYLGIKIPPPDPKALARSTELTKAAKQIYDSNSRTMFQIAIDQLDEAIKLNPNNQDAVALKDRVQTAVGGQSLAVLSAEDEQRYQQAVLELQRGNKITASAIVEQLLQNSKTKNSSKIIDLKMRIDSQL